MKLSLPIIADKLSEFDPEMHLTAGERCIRGVRPLLPETAVRPDMLYVAAVPGGAACTCGEERMTLRTDDTARVISAILDVFEDLQEWQRALDAAAEQGSTVQRFLDLSSDVLPFPTVITDPFGNVVGRSGAFAAQTVDRFWQGAVRDRHAASPVFSAALRGENGEPAEEWSATPKIYVTDENRIIGAHLCLNGEMVGYMVMVEYGRRLTQGTCQLAETLCAAIARALDVQGENAELCTAMTMAENFFRGRPVDLQLLWERVTRAARRDEEDLELVLFHSLLHTHLSFLNSFAYRLAGGPEPCFSLVFRSSVAAVICVDREEAFLASVRDTMPDDQLICGVSLQFSTVDAMQKAMGQAALALRSGPQTAGTVSRCVDYAYTYLVDKLAGDSAFGTELLHPGLARLKKYDEKHGTQFYETLYAYLSNERNVVATARSLFIHRNSMIYRLQRIRELLQTDLDDPRMRSYLLLSYHIENSRGNPTASLLADGAETRAPGE